jgi:RIO kinase 1
MPKITREKWKTWGNVFDEFTIRTLFKLSSQGHFENLESPLFIGKESNVFSAKTKTGKIVVKIYRLHTCDFNRMYDYIKSDPRYSSLKKQRRQIIFAWTKREYRNLMKAREFGVRCPTPLAVMNNVLLLEFIGDDYAAPKLKDLPPENPEEFLDEIIKNYKKLHKCGLVHADFSSFNILNYNEKPVFIDFSQCTSIEDSRAEEYLDRDIRNICNYFRKIGFKVSEEDVKKKILF